MEFLSLSLFLSSLLQYILFEKTDVAGSKRSCLQNASSNLNAIPEVSYGSCLPDFGGWCQESPEEQGTLMVVKLVSLVHLFQDLYTFTLAFGLPVGWSFIFDAVW